jgi:hypothetical protein
MRKPRVKMEEDPAKQTQEKNLRTAYGIQLHISPRRNQNRVAVLQKETWNYTGMVII